MSRARAVAVLVAVVAGLGAAALLGWPVGPFALAGALLCLAGGWLAPLLVSAPWPLVTLAVLVGIGGWVGVGAPPRAALGVALIYLQVHRVLGRTGPADDRVSLLLSGLMLVAAASASESVAWFFCFGPWAFALPVALLPSGYRSRSAGSARVVVGMAGATFALAAVLFPLLPRVRSDRAEEEVSHTVGFAPTVELGATDELLDDPGEVFRVEADPVFPEVPVYFRGVVLDRFDGRSWRSTIPGDRTLLQAPSSWPGDAVIFRFAGEAPDGALFTPGQVIHVEAGGRPLRRDRHGAWRADEVDGATEWMVVARGPWGPGSPVGLTEPPRPDAYLQLPKDLDPRVAELARELRGELTDPRRIADRVADWLRDNAEYTRAPRDAGGEAPLSTFLFDRKTGHCEYFASAEAVLLRAASVQTRVVNGFVGGESDPVSGDTIVRRYHAHAWTEVWVPGQGWVLIDATPGPGAPTNPGRMVQLSEAMTRWWEEGVIGFDRSRQEDALVSAGAAVEHVLHTGSDRSAEIPWLGLAILWGAALLLAVAVERLLRRVGRRLAGEAPTAPRSPVDRAWRKAKKAVEASGSAAPRGLPPLSAARWLGERHDEVAGPLEELAWLLYRVHHGGEPVEQHAERARDLARQVVQGLGRRATG